MVNNTV
ncbi:hypothetical protein ECPA10_1431, partial [Escherichia coli PA10]